MSEREWCMLAVIICFPIAASSVPRNFLWLGKKDYIGYAVLLIFIALAPPTVWDMVDKRVESFVTITSTVLLVLFAILAFVYPTSFSFRETFKKRFFE